MNKENRRRSERKQQMEDYMKQLLVLNSVVQ